LLFVNWYINIRRPTKLTPTMAASLISAAPEFNRGWVLIAVTGAGSPRGFSEQDSGYAAIVLRRIGSTEVIKAVGVFQYRSSAWHLVEFRYGQPPNVTSVNIAH
jgi:hypothetical protein